MWLELHEKKNNGKVTAAVVLLVSSFLCHGIVADKCGTVELRSLNNSFTKSDIRISIETQIGSTVLNSVLPKCQKSNGYVCGDIFNFHAKFRLRESCSLELCTDTYINSETCSNYSNYEEVNIAISESSIFHCACSSYPNRKFNVDFNGDYLGVVFQPYTKRMAKWNDYSFSDVQTMLKITATKFSWISTYGIGSSGLNSTWKDGDASGFVPVAAAQINKESNEFRLRVLAAIWPNYEREDLYVSEITNAFMASKEANEVYPNTVYGIIFTSNSLSTAAEWKDLKGRLKEHRQQADLLGLKLGIRLDNCEKLFPPKLTETDNGLYSAPNNYSTLGYLTVGSTGQMIFDICAMLDFVICVKMPEPRYINKKIADIVKILGNESFLSLHSFFEKYLPNLSFFGQTGWPSQGISDNLSPNTLRNMRDYWDEMNKWSAQNKVKMFMFESMDEPYKTDPNNKDETSTQGVNGSESHYGWWERRDSKNSTSYIEKYTEIPQELEAEVPFAENTEFQLVAIFVPTLVVLVAVSAILLYLYKRQKSYRSPYFIRLSNEEVEIFKEGLQDKTGDNETDHSIALRFPYDKSWEISKSNFSYDRKNVIGSGSSGVVYKGTIVGIDHEVAFKTTGIFSTIAHVRSLLSEIKLLSYIGHHSNIVKFLGANTENIQSGEVYLAIEYCSMGNLEHILRHRKYGYVPEKTKINGNTVATVNYVSIATADVDDTKQPEKEVMPLYFSDLVRWCYEIADAMEFISSKKIVHADLACRNILLTVDQTAKITDFGLSRKLYKYAAYLRFNEEQPLPWRWMAPESLKRLIFSSETDIWSFGVMLWEIFSLGDIPYPGLAWSHNFSSALELGLRLPKPEYSTDEIYEIMRFCWNADPTARITFDKLKEFFGYLCENNSEIYLKKTISWEGKCPDTSDPKDAIKYRCDSDSPTAVLLGLN